MFIIDRSKLSISFADTLEPNNTNKLSINIDDDSESSNRYIEVFMEIDILRNLRDHLTFLLLQKKRKD